MDNKLLEEFCNYYRIENLKVDEPERMRFDPSSTASQVYQQQYRYYREQMVTMTLPRRSLDRMVEVEFRHYEEAETRRRNPAAAKAYEHYKLLLTLVR